MRRAELVETKHPELSIRRQCELLHVTRSAVYYKPMEQSESDRRIVRVLDEIYMIDPCMGSRRLVVKLREDYGIETNRKHVQRLRQKMGIETIWCRPRRTSTPDNGHRKYPYLLKGRKISEADEVWCTDITYIPMPQIEVGTGHWIAPLPPPNRTCRSPASGSPVSGLLHIGD